MPQHPQEEMRRHTEVNWSAVMRKAVQAHLRKLAIADAIADPIADPVAKKTELTGEDIKEFEYPARQYDERPAHRLAT